MGHGKTDEYLTAYVRLSVNHDWNIVVSQHRKIFEAIDSRNVRLAEEYLIEHLRLVDIEKNTLKQEHPEFFV